MLQQLLFPDQRCIAAHADDSCAWRLYPMWDEAPVKSLFGWQHSQGHATCHCLANLNEFGPQAARAPTASIAFRASGELDAPPYAWTELWREAYSDAFGMIIVGYLRCWGCVFWNKNRFETKVTKSTRRKQKAAMASAIHFIEAETKNLDEIINQLPFPWGIEN
ncbi:hypothetical protein F5Y16DRAFT_273200 [Xylariaceae sp. FL0255]|nr:hypothetical protein F5Y16DRAFT_273200 [Xylariaceae sp. FL0255]